MPTEITLAALLDRHDGLLLDAYGVLIDGGGLLPGAAALFTELARRELPYTIVTNDASRSPERYARKFAELGVAVPAARVVTAGSLIPGYFAAHGLAGARTCVLGTDDSRAAVIAGGGALVKLEPGLTLDVLAICDDAGFDFLRGMELTLSAVVRAVEEGRRPTLLLPNPDLVYPRGPGELGLTAGAMALVIEAALARRFPGADLRFHRLGKPSPDIFHEGLRRLGGATRPVMLGDQLETDVAGAAAAGIPAALVAGVSRWEHAKAHAVVVPAYVLASLL